LGQDASLVNLPASHADLATYPHLAQQAVALARDLGFPLTRGEANGGGPTCCLPGVGRLLAMLAAARTGGALLGEIGTGTGFGAAWIASGMPKDARLVTIELDDERAAAAQRLFAADDRVTVVPGDAAVEVPSRAPFDLLFVDGGLPLSEPVVEYVRVGGQLVVDDVTPTLRLDQASPFQTNDAKRALFFGSSRLQSIEVVLPDLENAAFVGTRTA
jgi:predicted O-methyltransferase YrrM